MSIRNGSEVIIKSVDCEKDLEVIFQENLKFDQQINSAVNKANRIIGLVRRTFTCLDMPTFLYLYKSLVRSYVDYGDLIWFPVFKKDTCIRLIKKAW